MQIECLKSSLSLREIHALFQHEEETIFLVSSLKNKLGTYNLLARRPYHTFSQHRGILFLDGLPAPKQISFETYLSTYLAKHFQINPTSLPIIDGLIGYVSYDFATQQYSSIPEAHFTCYDELLLEEIETGKIWLIEHGRTGDASKHAADLKKEIRVSFPANGSFTEDKKMVTTVLPELSKKEYQKRIRQVIQSIVEGDIYVANLTQRFIVKSTQSPFTCFSYLLDHNPAPFSGYFNYGKFQIISSSPERFFEIRNKKITTRPIKGTVRRGTTHKEDQLLKKQLACSKKDKSELMMITDLERNDLNRVCQPGTVKVTKLFEIETYATVHHLISEVTGTLSTTASTTDAFFALFPGGSITGAPKKKAVELLKTFEESSRGIYTGVAGYFSFDGDCDWNILIRTALYQEGSYVFGVGGGITYESDPDAEYEEIYQKAAALFRGMGVHYKG